MSKRCMRIEELENGYTVCITIPSETIPGSCMYPEPLEFVAQTKEEVHEFLGQFLDHQAIKQESSKRDILIKPKQGSLIGAGY